MTPRTAPATPVVSDEILSRHLRRERAQRAAREFNETRLISTYECRAVQQGWRWVVVAVQEVAEPVCPAMDWTDA